MKRRRLLAVALAVPLLLAGCGSGASPAGSQGAVSAQPTAASSTPTSAVALVTTPTAAPSPAAVVGVSATAPAASPPAGAASPPVAPTAPAAVAWTRPMDVQPLPAEGKFKVIAQRPAPGDKVRVFFMGAQF